MHQLVLTKEEDDSYQVELGSVVRFKIDEDHKDLSPNELDHMYLGNARQAIINDLYIPLIEEFENLGVNKETVIRVKLALERAMQVSFNDID
jgi:hypothetical protein